MSDRSPFDSPFDAVLLISFGGPQGPQDIRPFLQNVLRGRRVPAERIEQVAHHYELFGGVSPLTELTQRQAAGLRTALDARAISLPIHIGMRNWHPLIGDTLRAMQDAGIRRAVGLIAAAHRSYSSCTQYKHNVLEAQATLKSADVPEVIYTGDWHLHEGFIEANADRITAARAKLPAALRERARIVFTAHSIPTSMAHADTYQRQLLESAEKIGERIARAERSKVDWVLVFQSRSGRPQDPWLEPDVNDYLKGARLGGVEAAILAPIGFVCDHIEVLYDLDIEAKVTAAETGIALARAAAVNDHPRFIDALADAVQATIDRYGNRRPLTLLSADTPNALELPPPVTR